MEFWSITEGKTGFSRKLCAAALATSQGKSATQLDAFFTTYANM